MGSGPLRARQSRSLPSLMPLSLKRLLIRPSDERSPISERKFRFANNRRRRLLAFFTSPRSTNGGRSSKRRESRRSEEIFARLSSMSPLPPKAEMDQHARVMGGTSRPTPPMSALCQSGHHSRADEVIESGHGRPIP